MERNGSELRFKMVSPPLDGTILADSATGALSASLEPALAVGTKQQYIVLLVDSPHSVQHLAPLVDPATAVKALGLDAASERVGVAVCSTGMLTETTEALKAAGADMRQVDMLMINAGTEIWYR